VGKFYHRPPRAARGDHGIHALQLVVVQTTGVWTAAPLTPCPFPPAADESRSRTVRSSGEPPIRAGATHEPGGLTSAVANSAE
jgi:hypothetical protein